MFVKLTNSGGRRYVQLFESYRDDQGRVKKRTVATLDGTQAVTGVSSMTAEQTQLFADLGIDKPTKVEQLTLL